MLKYKENQLKAEKLQAGFLAGNVSRRGFMTGAVALGATLAGASTIVEQALAKGKGVIFVGLHMGNWEMLLPFAAEKGHYAALVTTNVPDERLNELIRQHRQRGNLELIPRGDPQTMRKILNCFKRNGILFLAVDQDTNVPSIWAPFFGMLAKTPVSVARFAMKTGAPVLGLSLIHI